MNYGFGRSRLEGGKVRAMIGGRVRDGRAMLKGWSCGDRGMQSEQRVWVPNKNFKMEFKWAAAKLGERHLKAGW